MHWAVKVLTDEGDREKSFFSKHWAWLGTGGFCLFASVMTNLMMRRPVMSGVPRHIGLTVGGAGIGQFINNHKEIAMAERDAQLRHYIELHPDLFPEPDRKTFAQVIERWVPVR